jgi:hypothetical protein
MSPSLVGLPRRSTRLRGPAVVAVTGAGAVALLRLRDPHGPGSYGICPSLALTGVPCPGCGGLRAVNDLTHGDVAAALGSNLLVVVLVAAAAVAWSTWAFRRWTGRTTPIAAPSPAWAGAALAVVVVFGVLRNLPVGAALAP